MVIYPECDSVAAQQWWQKEGVKGQRGTIHSLNLRAKITHTNAKTHMETQLCSYMGMHTQTCICLYTHSLRPK